MNRNEEILALVRPNIRALSPYSTARDEFGGKLGVFLDANESPYQNGWNRYPDPRQQALKKRIGAWKGIGAEQIFLGNGSDEAIDLLFRIFCRPGVDNAVAISPSYGMYAVAAAINDVPLREVPLAEDFSLRPKALLQACDAQTKLLFLCSPNNPTGNAFPRPDIRALLAHFGGILVVDEAYADFSEAGSLLAELPQWPRLVILQTCSKARGLAALRLGMAFADPLIIQLMSQVKYPYNINEATQRLAMEALSQPMDAQVREIVAERGRVARMLASFPFVRKVYPSDANFLLVRVDDADALYEHLIADGIIVRNRNRVPLCRGCLRITIGLQAENDKLLTSLQAYAK
ncbi:MAG: histidinol-phosphate transaminase [Bacteroidales bacterium]|nr:histidinol-phosphate transaminase [Bacteroidales bacterium]